MPNLWVTLNLQGALDKVTLYHPTCSSFVLWVYRDLSKRLKLMVTSEVYLFAEMVHEYLIYFLQMTVYSFVGLKWRNVRGSLIYSQSMKKAPGRK